LFRLKHWFTLRFVQFSRIIASYLS